MYLAIGIGYPATALIIGKLYICIRETATFFIAPIALPLMNSSGSCRQRGVGYLSSFCPIQSPVQPIARLILLLLSRLYGHPQNVSHLYVFTPFKKVPLVNTTESASISIPIDVLTPQIVLFFTNREVTVSCQKSTFGVLSNAKTPFFSKPGHGRFEHVGST